MSWPSSMSLLRAFSFRVRGMSRATGCPRSVMRMTCPAFALATHTLARCRSSRIPIFSTLPSVAHHVLHGRGEGLDHQRAHSCRSTGVALAECEVDEAEPGTTGGDQRRALDIAYIAGKFGG